MKRPLLAPLVPVYAAGLTLHDALRPQPQRLAVPVVSVGSLSAGGAGKTPFTIALARLLLARGYRVDVLSRGYGRRETEPVIVDPDGSADRYGDEPLQIARATGVPVYVAAQRLVAGRLAELMQPVDLHLLDDGFQHRQLHRSLDIVLVSADDLADTLLPAGNRREPIRAAQRADLIAAPAADIAAARFATALGKPLWTYSRQFVCPVIEERAVAFCGIARPQAFFADLRAAGVALAATVAFPDHHRFTARDLVRLRDTLRNAGATRFVTTAKDAVRLGTMAEQLSASLPAQQTVTTPLAVADVEIRLDDPDGALQTLIQLICNRVPGDGPATRI